MDVGNSVAPPPGRNYGLIAAGLGCAGLMGLVLSFLLLILIGSNTGLAGFIVGAVVACLPAPFYIALALWLDRFEPEPPHYLLGAFLWGSIVSVFIAYILNTMNGVFFNVLTANAGLSRLLASVVSAPVVEEGCKGLLLLILFFFARSEFDGIVDGVIYATMVALGFAMTENILYYGRSFSSNGLGGVAVVSVLRGVLSPYSHPLFTCMTGIGLGWSRQSDNTGIKVLAPIGGFVAAISLHALWNLTASLHAGLWLVAYVCIMVPAALAVLTVVGFSLKRERGLLQTYLQTEVEEQRLSSADYTLLLSIPRRIGGGFRVMLSGGPLAWLAFERFCSAASELAFVREKRRRGLVSEQTADSQESLLRQSLQSARAKFSL